ncbi:hypothetical protein RvY_14112 [Ramazzottius varieornatus]|uniref:BTB domain-containing protein n=1 Tax=Ramazzottius varieornatus TaxID=947166 RepID=A0A1D1VU33_RAMVA|nr:hypothetical protein RvY_14112 [Ramazzottius varieornatus]
MPRGSISPGTSKMCDGGDSDVERGRQRCQKNAGLMWNNLWCSKDFSDVTLHSSDGVAFKLHKLPLVARSPVVSEAWKTPEVELVDGAPLEVVQFVRQFPFVALKNFFYALYTGSCDIIKDRRTAFHHFCTDIYSLAHHFQVQDIMDMSYFLMKNRKLPSNAVEIYLLAVEVKDETLRSDAERYIVSRRQDVMKSEAWLELKDQKSPVYTELLEAMALV